ncbi:MAG: 30S ribosomal protein S9 [Flavobacteriales bacterium]|nr:30S ribosomal protein S9 [Flavobacteriales bacterium]
MDVINSIGRRKKSIARVYLSKGKGNVTVNGKDFKEYFPTVALQYRVNQPFVLTENEKKFDVKANISGGGITGQAEALRLAMSRALVELDAEHKPALKAEGLMTRDPRMVERKKPGQKKARKKFQFSKR